MKPSIGAAITIIALLSFIGGYTALDYYNQSTKNPGPLTGATSPETDGLNQIVVDGVGLIQIDPDQAILSFGVLTQEKTATQAIDENADIMSNVVNAIKAMGIPDDDIKTSRFSLWTVYNDERTIPIGFRVSNQITVITHEIDRVGQLIDSIVSAGANQVNSVSFSLSEEAISEIRFEALDLAIEDAEAKANAIAKKLNLNIVGVGHVSESTGFSIPYYADTASYEKSTTPIEPGQVSYTASIHIVFLFE